MLPAGSGLPFATSLPASPYPGLRPFEANEWMIFFGREGMIDDIIDRLARQHLVFIHGASGSGKSSLVRAGVLPRLARQHLRIGETWLTCAMRPSGGPLWNLAAEFAKLEGRQDDFTRIGQIVGMFSRRDVTFSSVVAELDGLSGKRLCILVDQFEELFRFERETSREEAELFIDLLVREIAVETDSDEAPARPRLAGNIHIIITMRSEFFGDCARFDGFAEAINRVQYLVPRLTREDLLQAIRYPAQLYGGEVTPELAERLFAEARGKPDELPLIQHGLMLFWNEAAAAPKADKISLSAQMLDNANGLVGLISDHAERVKHSAAIDRDGELAIEKIFRALTDVNADGKAIRRPQTFAELIAITGLPPSRVRGILDAFRAEGVSFLTPYMPAAIFEETIIDISHEALIRCWAALADWMREEARAAEIYRDLEAKAYNWDKQSKKLKPSRLLHGYDRRDALAWWKDKNPTEPWARRYSKAPEAGVGFTTTKRLLDESEASWRRDRNHKRLGIGAAAAVVAVVALFYGAEFVKGYAKNRGDSYYAGLNAQPDYAKALTWYRKAAWLGDVLAALDIGKIYDDGGHGVTQNFPAAIIWYQKAAAAGNAEAAENLGILYQNGYGVAENDTTAMAWYEKSAAEGDMQADFDTGDLFFFGRGMPIDYPKAMFWFQKAAMAGNIRAENNIGVMYRDADGVDADPAQAMVWFQKSAVGGDSYAAANVGDLYHRGIGVSQDDGQAMVWYKRGASTGNAYAEGKIADLYRDGAGVPVDYGQALTWYQKAAASDNMDDDPDGTNHGYADANIGDFYRDGDGVKQDFAQALSWYQKAADNGNIFAEDQIGDFYRAGHAVKQDYATAMTWYQKAAATGDAEGQEGIGELYANGLGVAQDYATAMTWFQKAAAGNYNEAQTQIGLLYLNGDGVKQNDTQAMNWFMKASGSNGADTEDAIGKRYLNGDGVVENAGVAMKWFLKSAADNSADAATQIGLLYLLGNGVKQDDDQALAWFLRASSGAGISDTEYAIGFRFHDGNNVPLDDQRAMQWWLKASENGSAWAADQLGLLYLNGKGIKPDRAKAAASFQHALDLAKTELQNDPKDPAAMNDVATQYLLNNDFQQAITMANQAFTLAPDQIWYETCTADALMMLNQTDAARQLYLHYKDVQDAGNGSSWKADVLSDFDVLKSFGRTDPLMNEIRKDFGS